MDNERMGEKAKKRQRTKTVEMIYDTMKMEEGGK